MSDDTAIYPVGEPEATGDLMRTLREGRQNDLVATCLELARRSYTVEIHRIVISNHHDAAAVLAPMLATRESEAMVGLYLNSHNMLIHREVLTMGNLNRISTSPREVFRPALLHGAYGVILGHNHPSGNLDPSPEDLAFTKTMQEAGDLLMIDVLDHIIIGNTGHTAFRERGLL